MQTIKVTNDMYWIWIAQSNPVLDTHIKGGLRNAFLLAQICVAAVIEKGDPTINIRTTIREVYFDLCDEDEHFQELQWLLHTLKAGYYPHAQCSEARQFRIIGRLVNGIMQGTGSDHIVKKIIQDFKKNPPERWKEIINYIKENSQQSAAYLELRMKWITM